MKEFIEKLIGRLEEEKLACHINAEIYTEKKISKIIDIVNQLAEEYINTSTDTSTDTSTTNAEWKQHILNRFEGELNE